MSSLISPTMNPQDPKKNISNAVVHNLSTSHSLRRTGSCDCKKYKAQERACPCSVKYTLNHVQKMLEQTLSDTSFFEPCLQAQTCLDSGGSHTESFQVPQYMEDDFILGDVIGRGGFCFVSEVKSMRANDLESTTNSLQLNISTSNSITSRVSQADGILQTSSLSYVVKYVRKDIMLNKKKFSRAMADLMIEAHFLAAIHHPNIIRLCGITQGVFLFHLPEPSYISTIGSILLSAGGNSIFLLLERVHTTLSKQIHTWKEKVTKFENRFGIIPRDWRGSQRQKLLWERLHVAWELARAMLYLHQNKIIYRDIKPDNIGFDMHGTLKLFDFGLAKELRPHKMLENGTYNLTGRTGSRRYMAPEVAMNKAYNSTADVYSFGILLHELCSLDKPFDGYTEAQHMDLVVIGGKRPLISHHGSHRFWPDSVRKLMEHCWLDDLHERPSFVEVIQILQSLGEDVVGSVVYQQVEAQL